MKLLAKRVLLKQIKKEYAPGELIDSSDIERFEVYEIGSEVTEVKVGDSVLYQQGAKFKIGEEEYILLEESDIILIL